MRGFLNRWLETQLQFLLCIYVPVLCALVFGMLKFYFYPESGMMSVWIVYLCAYIFVVYKCRKL